MLCISLTVFNRQYKLKYKAFDYIMETSLKLHHGSNPTCQVFQGSTIGSFICSIVLEKSILKKCIKTFLKGFNIIAALWLSKN